MTGIKSKIDAVMGRIKPTLVLKNLYIINVFDESIEKGDIAIYNDTIVGIGSFSGTEEMDCSGLFASPGFIDSHVHVESSMVTPELFSRLVIKHGVTTAIADPHEIANVMGKDGISFMMNCSKRSSIDIYYMLPSCVPCTDFEDNAGKLDADDILNFINEERVLGLGEVMDVPSVVNCETDMLKKIELSSNKIIDGHCPKISDNWLNAYILSGVKTDHECSSPKEALDKIKRGMYVMIREGSAAKNLEELVPAVKEENFRRFLFCTDDRHIEDIYEEGSIDYCIRKAIKKGLLPVKAFIMATINAAECYGLKNKGAIAPGYAADIVIFDDINDVNIKYIFKNGKLYSEENFCEKSASRDEMAKLDSIQTYLNINYIDKSVFKIESKTEDVNVIRLIPNSIETRKEVRKVITENDEDGRKIVKAVAGEDIIKIAVFERHKNTGKKAVGFVDGFGLKGCSVAQTIAHDSHNVIVVGDSDNDMAIAVNSLINIGGGIAIVSEGKLIEYISLPVAGLMTKDSPSDVLENVKKLKKIARKFGVKEDFDPFLTLAFLALPVIPEIKITARGIFDYNKFDFIDLFC